jgi:hypothetical protein
MFDGVLKFFEIGYKTFPDRENGETCGGKASSLAGACGLWPYYAGR